MGQSFSNHARLLHFHAHVQTIELGREVAYSATIPSETLIHIMVHIQSCDVHSITFFQVTSFGKLGPVRDGE